MLGAGGCSVLFPLFFLLCGSVWFFNLPSVNVLGFMPTVIFLMQPAPAQSISILFMLTLCMQKVIGCMCKPCACTCPGDPGTMGIDPMAFTRHDMVLQVPLNRCVVQGASLKLKEVPHTEHQHTFQVHAHTLHGMHGMWWCGGVVVWCCGVVV